MPPANSGCTVESEAPASGKLLSMTRKALERPRGGKHLMVNTRKNMQQTLDRTND